MPSYTRLSRIIPSTNTSRYARTASATRPCGTPCAEKLSVIGGPTNERSSSGDGTGRPSVR